MSDLANVKTCDEVMKEHIVNVLGLCDWNYARAAKALGIDRRTVYRICKRNGVERPTKAVPGLMCSMITEVCRDTQAEKFCTNVAAFVDPGDGSGVCSGCHAAMHSLDPELVEHLKPLEQAS